MLVRTSTQDLGTGQRTVTAIVAAEILGLEPERHHARIGESQYGRSSGSGGSTTCPSQAPATLRAATAARDDLFAKIAAEARRQGGRPGHRAGQGRRQGQRQELGLEGGLRRLGMEQAKATATGPSANR